MIAMENRKVRYCALALASVSLAVVLVASHGVSMAQVTKAGYQASLQSSGLNSAQTEDYMEWDSALMDALEQGGVGKARLINKDALKEFYAARHNQPYWMSESGLYSRADRMAKAVEEAWTHGLNPYAYHHHEIVDLMDEEDMKSRAQLELLLSDAFVRYTRDLSGKRVDGRVMNLREQDWKQRVSPKFSLDFLASASGDFDDVLSQIEPQGQTYKMLRKELISLVNQGADPRESLLPISFSGILKPGNAHGAVPKLRAYFDMPEPRFDPSYYDDRLAGAIVALQNANGLKPDGVVGPNTLEVINRTTQRKIEQLVVNLERLRWAWPNTESKYVIVNIPSATLWAIKDDMVAFEMPVIVGKASRQTQIFHTKITGLRINPDWTVPPTIKKVDLLPKIKADPGYFDNTGMSLIQGYGSEAVYIDPHSVDWENISWRELNAMRMVQTPGDNNPLGRYRVLMPNEFNIYLHDTNHPEQFNAPDRALSSGCVRMKEPHKMALFLLEEARQWDEPRLNKTLESYRKTDVAIDHQIPVSLFYYTVWAGENGDIIYGSDIYNYDRKLFSALASLDGVYIPLHNGMNMGNVSDAHASVIR